MLPEYQTKQPDIHVLTDKMSSIGIIRLSEYRIDTGPALEVI